MKLGGLFYRTSYYIVGMGEGDEKVAHTGGRALKCVETSSNTSYLIYS